MTAPIAERDGARDAELAEHLGAAIRRYGLEVPAIWFLQTFKPLSFLGSQMLLFFEPVLSLFQDAEPLRDYARFLEDGQGIELVLRQLE